LKSRQSLATAWKEDSNGFATTLGAVDGVSTTPCKDLLQLIMLLPWTCLNHTHKTMRSGVFDKLFSTRAILAELLTAASMAFAPGLLDTIHASTPPSLSFFKSLPTECSKKWAVYLLVMEKKKCTPRLYTGSGTHAVRGAYHRLLQYDTGHSLPKYVRAALDEGFKITHKGILCSAPIPSAAEVPRLRALFILLEAMFTFVFWTIRIKTDYGLGMHGLRQWSVESLGYDGLCSHNTLRETVVGDIDLSAEELEELEQEIKRKQTDRSSKSYKKMKLQSPERKREDARLATERFRTAKRETTRESNRKNIQKAKDEKRFYDHVCQRAFGNQH
jgi:hypothetical protein